MSTDQIRFLIFIGILAVMLFLEWLIPRHFTIDSKPRRLGINFSLTGLNVVIVKAVLGGAAVGAAVFAGKHGWGLFNYLHWPAELEMAAGIIFLDLMIYIQHVVLHMIPFFWRFHVVHHSDLDLDVSSGFRFHPLEILGSMIYKIGLVVAIGPSPMTVVVFEAILSGMAQFTHSNIKLPLWLDRVMRWLFVTPDMHRIHHSVVVAETNSNYGFNLSIWDRLLGTYKHRAEKPQPEIVIGVPEYRWPEEVSFSRLLLMPLRPNRQISPES
ncbi:MAG: sterol desaturase family protein [Nitrospinaceae bacterium]|nr:sterol desaturase family protein [Nitrospinaceae bacterium]NIR53578.1 sterol desaturase family protein [Nitrospinaceae bacterium]NIS83979.1 sterol desaturase family protein [Nitrospinaceae bacterium]NIT80788.1 sterol desaturase family protein [Nitrospinaceae bacterium]NIU43094.1 sterol desaturase family protein [Nitrospinaceae bacterium]